MTTWNEVWDEHRQNIGFVEGAGNRNPWSEEVGAGDAAYCISAACIVPYHHGIRWWPESQFGEKGYAYCPYARKGAEDHGIWQYDHASRGAPCDLLPGDIVLFDWNNDGVADHAETVVAVYADLTFDDIGYNTGNPEGCHYPVRRNRKYLLGRIRMQGNFYHHAPAPPIPPTPPGGTVEQDFSPPFDILGHVVSTFVPPEGGVLIFTDQGYVYALGGAQYHGGPIASDAETNWRAGRRVGAKIGPPDRADAHYTCVDTAGERYTF